MNDPPKMVHRSTRVLVNAGIKEKVAVNIALAIKEGLSWFF